MRKFTVFLGSLLSFIIFSTNAFSFSFDLGSDSYIDTSGTNSVLEMEAMVFDLDGIVFDLDYNQSKTFAFGKIWTSESWINDDDIIPGTITAGVDFDTPDMTSIISGQSAGFTGCLHFVQGWELVWNDPVYVAFADGIIQIELSDAFYASGFWLGPDGADCITATVTYLEGASTAPVPEPASIMLLGTGLLGLARFRRKKK